jgi:hypothetical protein
MRHNDEKNPIWSVFAVAAALVMFVVAACAADPNPSPLSPSAAGTTQPGAGPATRPQRPGPGDPARPDALDMPQILLVAAVNPRAKNDPEVQTLLDKAIADLQVVQQDEAARLLAFQKLVQSERSGDADSIRTAREGVNSATVKLAADARQFNQQDMGPLRKRVHELMSNGGPTPDTAHRPAPPSAPPSAQSAAN